MPSQPREVELRDIVEESRRQRELLEQVMSVAPVGIAVLRGPEHRFEYVNPSYNRLSRTFGRDILGRTVEEVFPGARQSGTLAVLDRVFKTGHPAAPREFETTNVTGSPTYWSYDAVPLRNDEGQVDGILVVEQDVTNQVQARKGVERLAREAEQRAAELDAVLKSLPQSLVIFDTDGRIRRSNDVAKALYDLTPAYEQTPLPERLAAREYTRPDGQPVTPESTPAARALKGETVRDAIMVMRMTSAAPPVWLSVSAAPLYGPGGELVGAVSTTTDITTQRTIQERLEDLNEQLEVQAEQVNAQNEELQCLMTEAEAAREEAEQRAAELEAVFASMAAGVTIYDTAGRIVRRNAAAEALLPFGPAMADLMPAERATALRIVDGEGQPLPAGRLPVVRALEGETIPPVVTGIHIPGVGRPRWLAISAAPVRLPDGSVRGAVTTMVDVTTLREAQQRLEAANEDLRFQGEEMTVQAEELSVQAEELLQRNAELDHVTAELAEQRAGLEVVLAQMPAGVLIAEAPSGRVVLVNRQAEELLRGPYALPNSPAEYMQFKSFFPDGREYRPEEMPLARSILHGERVAGEEIHFMRGDGTQGVQIASSSPVYDGQGQIVAGVLTFYDITERKATEEALWRAQERHQAFLAISSEAIWRVELEVPVPVELPEDKQLELLYERGYLVECNEAMARLHGFESREEMLGSRLGQLMPRLSAANVELLRAFIRGHYHVAGVESAELGRQGEVRYFLTSLMGIVDPATRALVRLWGVKRDLTDLKRADEALRQETKERAAVEERQRLARDLHDAVSQTLFSASLIADVLPKLYAKDPGQGQALLDDLRRMTRGSLAELRALLVELRPEAIAEGDIGSLIRQLAEATAGRTQMDVVLSVEASCRLPQAVQVAFYRIAQEALYNVSKHSGATKATIRLRCTPGADLKPAHVELHVEDNGRGFDPEAVAANHFGLSIMAERAQEVGATLVIDTSKGSGTRIAATWTAGQEPSGGAPNPDR